MIQINEVSTCDAANEGVGHEILPAFFENSIPVCFSTDQNYVPYFAVALQSLIENSSDENNYDIFILEDGISSDAKRFLKEQAAKKENISVRFINVEKYLTDDKKSKMVVSGWFTIATYYRMILPEILVNYDKILYLDCDLVVLDDVAKLFKSDINDVLLAAAYDIGVARLLFKNEARGARLKSYIEEQLGVPNAYDYFQAGVLLMNLKKMREVNLSDKCFEFLALNPNIYWVDQCVLNAVCVGRVKYLPIEWNMTWHVVFEADDLEKELPPATYDEYCKAHNASRILHYSGGIKPWFDPKIELSSFFWKYARNVAFYEQIIFERQKYLLILIHNLSKYKLQHYIYIVLYNTALNRTQRKKYARKINLFRDKILEAKEFLNA